MNSAAERLYLLAGLLWEPDDEECRTAAAEFNLAATADELLAAYRYTFVDPNGPRLAPVESVFKPWTTAQGATLLIAREEGWLGGDSAAHLRCLYHALGLEVPPRLAYAPDHLALELTFYGLLLEQGTVEMQATFRDQHLDWLGKLQARARELGVPEVYRRILDECQAAILPQPQTSSSADGASVGVAEYHRLERRRRGAELRDLPPS